MKIFKKKNKVFFCYAIVIALTLNESVAQIDTNGLDLMPVPKSVTQGQGKFRLERSFHLNVTGAPDKRIFSTATRFLARLSGRTGLFLSQGYVTEENNLSEGQLTIDVVRPGRVELNEDESYALNVSGQMIALKSETDIGAIRGLETLLQLISVDEYGYYLPVVEIKDAPRFAWRGLMIDVARHFQPIDVIKRNLDAMAAVKLNVFHWHLTDDQGFRVESKAHPKLHEMGSDGFYYTHEQIKDVVRYAEDRGIIVIPEFDVPGHASAILTAYPDIASKDTTYQIERFAGIFDPTLDPTNERTYVILKEVFEEIAPLFPGKYFHIGGDENEGKHWHENPAIQKFMKKNGLKSNHDLQTHFNIRLEKILNHLGKELMGWEEIMTPNMPKTAIIHSWRGENEGLKAGESLIKAAKQGYRTVLSNGYYIDLMFPASQHYLIDPIPNQTLLGKEEKERILGGEATMWSELVTPLTIDSRIWPRTAAIAERLWSPAEIRDVEGMYSRLEIISQQLEELGLTHIKNQDVILRNIARGGSIEPLRTLVDVVSPMQKYTRNPMGTMYKSYSPFTLFADAATADSKVIRNFDALVYDYLKDGEKLKRDEIRKYLEHWSVNHREFKKLLENSPALQEIEQLSWNFSHVAQLTLNCLDDSTLIKDGAWAKEYNKALIDAEEQGGRTKLRVLESLSKLIKNLRS